MLVGTLTETLVGDNGQKQKTREEQLDAMEKLSKQVAQVQQDAMNKVYAQAPMQNQMREKMVSTFPYTRYLQDVFMARQKPRTIADFHAGAVVTSRMMERPVPLPVPKLSDSIVNK